MKLKHLLSYIVLIIILAATTRPAQADLPFRNHRFSGFQSLPICMDGDIVFIGNSITNMHDWYEGLGGQQNVHNRGTSGGLSSEIIDNLESMIAGNPSKVFLMIGINDLRANTEPATVVANTQTIINRIREEVPGATVYYQSVLPASSVSKNIIETTNSSMKNWIDAQGDSKIVFVDLYCIFNDGNGNIKDTSATSSATSYSWDGLHPSQRAYHEWLNHLISKGYLTNNFKCVYPENFDNNWGGQTQSLGMRTTLFGAETITADDIIMLGDEIIHSGEWHEYMGSANVKNRGNNWGEGPSLHYLNSDAYLNAIFANNSAEVKREAPKAICIYAGYKETANGSSPFTSYQEVISRLRSLDGGLLENTPIFLMTVGTRDDQSGVNSFNTNLKNTYGNGQTENVYVVDIASVLNTKDDFTSSVYQSYLSGLGYAKMANLLATALNEKTGTNLDVYSIEEAEKTIELYQVLTAIYKDKNLNYANKGEKLSLAQQEKFKELLPHVRAKLKRGNIDEFNSALQEAYEEARQ